jgi:two-component system CheB/CheR fusion protein
MKKPMSQKAITEQAADDSAVDAKNVVPATFPIVGIGASAGGLEAFEQFFHAMPANCGLAFVLIPHLDPNHASLLTEILQRATAMPVVEALDQIPVEPNWVYIIPPNRDMEIFHGKLQLSMPHVERGLRMAIDGFLRSLAEDQAENAIGIILSGTGSDGTLGLRAIHGAGGITLVQEPSTAKYNGMPSSAVDYATFVLPVEKMPETLLTGIHAVAAHPEILSTPKEIGGINRILMQLRNITGHDFSQYKKTTINRRIERRMAQHHIEDTEVYVRYLKEHSAEVEILFKELLINVTNFFRDPEAFGVLEKDILPELCKGKTDGSVFRIWVTGCSTGEEAYSIAILLRELMDNTHREFKVQFYSTDLDNDAIAIARAGLYPANIVQDITLERLRRFFTKEETGYRVKKEIREMIVFAVQNVIKDPPFTKLDLLSCRNLMIYLTPELQNRLIPAFHYALQPDGVLFLSPSESIGNHTELFFALNRKWKFYRATHTTASARTLMTSPLIWTAQDGYKKAPEQVITADEETNFSDLCRRVLVQFFAPASIITNLNGDILYVYGETGKYLRPAPGHATLNVIEMAREGLGLELHTAIHSAADETIPRLNQLLQVKTNGDFTTVSLSVRPLPSASGSPKLLLVSFQDIATVKSKRKRTKPAERGRIEELERELAYLKENYQISTEGQQASNEELKSTNEELQSTNEEMQSANEELETSREELQSVNEELITVNSELQNKIEQLADIQNDMKNLLDNVNVGIVFLDRDLIIRRYTREALSIYRLVASDIGRSLNDIKSVVDGDELLVAARTVLESLIPYEQELTIGDDTYVLVRIKPYRTLGNIIDGVVMTFTDISSRIKALSAEKAALCESEARLSLILAGAELAVWDWNISTGHVVFNEHWANMRGYRLADVQPVIGSWKNNIFPDDRAEVQNILTAHFEGFMPKFKAEYRVHTQSGAWIWIMCRGMVISRDAEGKPLRMTGVEIDITELKQA